MKPVYETVTKEIPYTVCKPVYETVTKRSPTRSASRVRDP